MACSRARNAAVGEGHLWSKLSGVYRLGALSLDYAEARPFHDALVGANPDNLVWGSDWLHPRPEGPMPDAAHLLEVFSIGLRKDRIGGPFW